MAARQVNIKIPGMTDTQTLGLLKGLMGQYRGTDEVCLHVACEEGEKRVRLTTAYGIAYNQMFLEAVEGILGEGAVWVAKG